MPYSKNGKPKLEAASPVRTSFFLDEGAEWGGFINVRLTDEQKESFHSWIEDNAANVALILDELLGAGMKVTISYDPTNVCFVCAFTGRLLVTSPARYVTTTRAGSLNEVLALACWKHAVLARGNYDDFMPKRGNFPNWG